MARGLKLRTVLLAGCLGGAALLAAAQSDGDDRTQVAANLAKSKPTPAASGPVRTAGASATKKPAAPPPPPPRNHPAHDDIDLSSIELDGELYRAALPGGQTAELTLDPTLQKAAEETLARAKPLRGAIVVMTPEGEVVALAGIENGEPAPAVATETWAPAASIFKIVTASALVDAGVSPNKRVCYHGGLRSVTAANLRDNKKRDRRCNDLGYAVAHSQNALIAKLAHKHLDPKRLGKTAEAFGMSSAPSFCADAEANSIDLPDDPLEFARVSAGFWHTELSPLGGALLANVIASRGNQVTPRLIRALVAADGARTEVEPEAARRVLPAKVADKVAAMMVGTTRRGGTGYKGFHDRRGRPFLKEIDVAGKTGTLTRGKPSYMQYSWFVGFAPADEPKLVISVLLGNPPKWHLKAHTAARLVLQQAF